MATQEKTVIAKPFSGDYRIDVLLDNVDFRWNFGSALATPVIVKYSFLTTPSSYATAEDKIGFSVFTSQEITATKQIFALISQLINISFVEVPEAELANGIRFANNTQEKSAGYAVLPQPSGVANGFIQGSGDLYMAGNQINNPSFAVGTYEYMTLVHEIAHAIGLNHPGNYNAGEPAKVEAGNYLATSEDNRWVSIMSYNEVPQGQIREFFGTYDMLALKYLYGGKDYNAESTNYLVTDRDGQMLKMINDTGGTDTLDVSNCSVAASINLNPGSNSSVGTLADGSTPAINNLSLAFDAYIENLIGTAFNDTLLGNKLDNFISGGRGSNTIDGAEGNDTAIYVGNRTTFTLSKKAEGGFNVEKPNADGSDTLTNIEVLKFADMSINLGVGIKSKTIDASALKSIVELYIAYFNRVPDADGMSYWIDQNKTGASIEQIGKSFYNAAVSPSFTALTGYSDSMSNVDFIKIIYKNVLGRNEVDQGGLDYWSSALGNGSQTRGSLIKTILDSAHSFKGRTDYGYVADLLDNKFAVAKYFSIDQGVNYNTPEESYSKGVLIAAAVTPTDTQAALTLIGIQDNGFSLT
jgi:serralysin